MEGFNLFEVLVILSSIICILRDALVTSKYKSRLKMGVDAIIYDI